MSTVFSYWLLPCEADAAPLRQQIRDLAAAHDGVPFEPHVTLYSGPSDADEVARTIERLRGSLRRLTLAPSGVAHSARLTKALFVRLQREPGLVAIYEAIRREAAQPSDYVFDDPHLSLLYATLPEAERNALAAEIAVPPPVAADGVEVIELETPVTSVDQIRCWRTVARFRCGE